MAKDPSIEYVEIDLHGVMEMKKRIVERLVSRSEVPSEPNLHLEEGNALDIQDLLTATHIFKAKPMIIANEGLLPYLNLDEKYTLGKNVHQLLGRFGGVWITPDISTQTQVSLSKDRILKRAAKVQNITGIDIMNNRFESEETARSFFESLGFVVEQHSFIEIADELVLPQRWKLAKEEIEKILGRLVAFVMKVNTT
jgi:O-methyltransferase involved in polyketide biosynthesis